MRIVVMAALLVSLASSATAQTELRADVGYSGISRFTKASPELRYRLGLSLAVHGTHFGLMCTKEGLYHTDGYGIELFAERRFMVRHSVSGFARFGVASTIQSGSYGHLTMHDAQYGWTWRTVRLNGPLASTVTTPLLGFGLRGPMHARLFWMIDARLVRVPVETDTTWGQPGSMAAVSHRAHAMVHGIGLGFGFRL